LEEASVGEGGQPKDDSEEHEPAEPNPRCQSGRVPC